MLFSPCTDTVAHLARILDVAPEALTVPDIDSYEGLLHTLFSIEDNYGKKVGDIDGELCLRLDRGQAARYFAMYDRLRAWQKMRLQYEAGEITQEEYDHWRYHYPASAAYKAKEEPSEE